MWHSVTADVAPCCTLHVNSFPPSSVLPQTIVLDRQTVGSSLCQFPPDSSRDLSTTPSQAQVRFHSLDLLRATSNRCHKRPYCCYYDLIKALFGFLFIRLFLEKGSIGKQKWTKKIIIPASSLLIAYIQPQTIYFCNMNTAGGQVIFSMILKLTLMHHLVRKTKDQWVVMSEPNSKQWNVQI